MSVTRSSNFISAAKSVTMTYIKDFIMRRPRYEIIFSLKF